MNEQIIECKQGDFEIHKDKNKYTIVAAKHTVLWGLRKIHLDVRLPDEIIAIVPKKKVANHKSLSKVILPGSDFYFYIFALLPSNIKAQDIVADIVFVETKECYVVVDTN